MQPPSGLEVYPPPFVLFGHPSHRVRFYAEEISLIDELEAFVCAAIENGHGAICFGATQHLAELADRKTMSGPVMHAAITEGRYLTMDVPCVLSAVMAGGEFDEGEACDFFATAITKTFATVKRRQKHVAVFGEIAAALWSEGNFADVLRLEHLWNNLVRAYPVTLLCGYPVEVFCHPANQEPFQMICEEHSAAGCPTDHPALDRVENPWQTVPHERLLAQERQHIQGQPGANCAGWERHYRAALLEADDIGLFEKVEIAQAAVLTRLREQQSEPCDSAERHRLRRAWHILQIVKKEELDFSG